MDARTKTAAGSALVAEVVRGFGEARFRALGTSMMPSIRPGDVLVTERRRLSEVGVGAIVLYEREQALFAHRVVEQRCDASGRACLLTRGDRQWRADEPVWEENLLGQVTAIERGDRTLRPDARPSWGGRLLRLLSRLSDWPAGLLVLYHRARG